MNNNLNVNNSYNNVNNTIYNCNYNNGYNNNLKKVKIRYRLYGILSIILGLIPILLYVYCIKTANGEDENGAGAIIWLLVIYIWSIGIPIFISSIVLGILSLKEKINIYAILGLIITLIPAIYISTIF